jgi:glutathione synthase/RimK-type ligase-like ATP-grasp enzyme
MPAVLGDKAMMALQGIERVLGLDYAGVDFGLNANGDLLLFEANATMIVGRPDGDERWTYRCAAIDRIVDAVADLIRQKAHVGSAMMGVER